MSRPRRRSSSHRACQSDADGTRPQKPVLPRPVIPPPRKRATGFVRCHSRGTTTASETRESMLSPSSGFAPSQVVEFFRSAPGVLSPLSRAPERSHASPLLAPRSAAFVEAQVHRPHGLPKVFEPPRGSARPTTRREPLRHPAPSPPLNVFRRFKSALSGALVPRRCAHYATDTLRWGADSMALNRAIAAFLP